MQKNRTVLMLTSSKLLVNKRKHWDIVSIKFNGIFVIQTHLSDDDSGYYLVRNTNFNLKRISFLDYLVKSHSLRVVFL